MEIGAAIGPYLDRIDGLGRSSPFAFVEIALGEGEVPLAEVDPPAVAERAGEGGLGVTVHLPYRQPLSTPVDRLDDATLSYLGDVLATGAAAGADLAVAHPGARGSGHEHDRLADRLARLTDRGREHGITVCFETVGYAGGVALEKVGQVADRADAAVCLDVGYAYREAGADGIADFLATYGDLVAHLHVHDTRRRGDTHLPVGSGDVEFDAVGEAVAAHAPEATAAVEVFTDDREYLRLSAERFRAAVDAARD
jgi:sugar phosphate isomerase/epimerase